MAYARPLLEAYPGELNIDADVLSRCIEACYECSQACTACADACLSEEDVGDLVGCIRLDLVCAGVCAATARALSVRAGHTETLETLLRACSTACGACAEECERHASHHEHCRICAEACRACRSACDELLTALSAR
jgi:hypothetical protein